jgi:exodeoxyribonuclease VII small subunit
MNKKIEELSFEEAFEKLNQILEKLESGEVALEKSIELYEEGMLLKNHCENKLKNAEMKIKKVVENNIDKNE